MVNTQCSHTAQTSMNRRLHPASTSSKTQQRHSRIQLLLLIQRSQQPLLSRSLTTQRRRRRGPQTRRRRRLCLSGTQWCVRVARRWAAVQRRVAWWEAECAWAPGIVDREVGKRFRGVGGVLRGGLAAGGPGGSHFGGLEMGWRRGVCGIGCGGEEGLGVRGFVGGGEGEVELLRDLRRWVDGHGRS